MSDGPDRARLGSDEKETEEKAAHRLAADATDEARPSSKPDGKAAGEANEAQSKKPAGDSGAKAGGDIPDRRTVWTTDGEKWQQIKYDKASGRCVLEQKGRGANYGLDVSTISARDLETNYTSFEVVREGKSKTYYYRTGDVTGAVFEPSKHPGGGFMMFPRHDLKFLPAESVLTEAPVTPGRGTGNDAPPAGLKKPEFKDKTSQGEIDGKKLQIKTDGPERRTYSTGGQDYILTGQDWWYLDLGNTGVARQGECKVHITTTGASDIARVQAVLIPALHKAAQPGGELHGMIHSLKTFDPMFGLEGKEWARVLPHNQADLKNGKPLHEPGPRGQNSKAFTIYPANDVAAKAIAEFCSRELARAGVVLDAGVRTGNVGDSSTDRASHRVSIDRSNFDYGRSTLAEGAALDPVLEEAVKEYCEKKVSARAKGWEQFASKNDLYEPDGRLKETALRQLALETKLDPQSARLEYGQSVVGERRLLLVSSDGGSERTDRGRYYLTEKEAGKEVVLDRDGKLVKGLNGRPAYYEISRVVGDFLEKDLAPANLAIGREEENARMNKPAEQAGWRMIAEMKGGQEGLYYNSGLTKVTELSSRQLPEKFDPKSPEGYVEIVLEKRQKGPRLFMDTRTKEIFRYTELTAGDLTLKMMVQAPDFQVVAKAEVATRFAAPPASSAVPKELVAGRQGMQRSPSVEILEINSETGRLEKRSLALGLEVPKLGELNAANLNKMVDGWLSDLQKEIDKLKTDPSKSAQLEELNRYQKQLQAVRSDLSSRDPARVDRVVQHFRRSIEPGFKPGALPEAVPAWRGRVAVGAGCVIGIGILVAAGLAYYNRFIAPQKDTRREQTPLPRLGK